MAALAADRNVPSKGLGDVKAYLVKASTTIYKGSMVSLDANGQALPSADTTLTHCIGVSLENVVQGSSVTKYVRVASGRHFLLPTGTIASTDLGKSVYISDSATVALTDTNAIFVGKLDEFVTTTSAWVFVPTGPQVGAAIA